MSSDRIITINSENIKQCTEEIIDEQDYDNSLNDIENQISLIDINLDKLSTEIIDIKNELTSYKIDINDNNIAWYNLQTKIDSLENKIKNEIENKIENEIEKILDEHKEKFENISFETSYLKSRIENILNEKSEIKKNEIENNKLKDELKNINKTITFNYYTYISLIIIISIFINLIMNKLFSQF